MTVVRSERRAGKPAPKLDEVEQIKRLIEIQKQIVELAKQNELTAKECEALRHELSQATRGRKSGPRFKVVRRAIERLTGFLR